MALQCCVSFSPCSKVNPGDLPNPGIEPGSPALEADSLPLSHQGTPVLISYLFYTHVLVAQSCPTLYDRMDCSPPGSSVRGILQAKVPEWIAMPFSGFIHSGVCVCIYVSPNLPPVHMIVFLVNCRQLKKYTSSLCGFSHNC